MVSYLILSFQDAYASERRKAKMLNFSIAYGKTANGLSRDWKVLTAKGLKKHLIII